MKNTKTYAAIFALATCLLTLAGCNTAAEDETATGTATTSAPAAPANVSGQAAPGNPNPNAASNAAAFEAARKKAEGK